MGCLLGVGGISHVPEDVPRITDEIHCRQVFSGRGSQVTVSHGLVAGTENIPKMFLKNSKSLCSSRRR